MKDRTGGRHARCVSACLSLARPFFLVPTTSKRLLRRLLYEHSLSIHLRWASKPGGLLDISLGEEVGPGPSYPDPV